jgi:hypothetical protein
MGPDEVWIGPADPIATVPTIDLWYDTDAEYAPVSAPNPRNALGIVAMGSLVPGPVTLTTGTDVAVTPWLAVTLTAGRRYRVALSVRAMNCPTPTYVLVRLKNGAAAAVPDVPIKYVNSLFDCLHYEWVFTGNGAVWNFNVAMWSSGYTSTAYTEAGTGFFYVEDMGPVLP